MDGLNLPVQTSHDQEIENATFNGWLHDHFVSSVFAFAPDGMDLISIEFLCSIPMQELSLLVISMHQAAGMIPEWHGQFTRSCEHEHQMAII